MSRRDGVDASKEREIKRLLLADPKAEDQSIADEMGVSRQKVVGVRASLQRSGLLPVTGPNYRERIELAMKLYREKKMPLEEALKKANIDRHRYQRGQRVLVLAKEEHLPPEARKIVDAALHFMEMGNVPGADRLVADIYNEYAEMTYYARGGGGGAPPGKRLQARKQNLARAITMLVQVCMSLEQVKMPISLEKKSEIMEALEKSLKQLRHFKEEVARVHPAE